MNRTKSTFLALVAVLLSPMAANADPIGIGDFGAGAQTTTFDGLGLPFINTAPLIVDGHTITTDTGDLRYANFGSELCVANECIGTNSDLGFIDVVLSGSFQRVGAWASGVSNWAIDALFYDMSDVLVGSISLSGAGQSPVFAGWENAGGISRIRFNDLTQNSFIEVFDNLVVERVSVPEPGTLALLGIGLFGMGLARRKKV